MGNCQAVDAAALVIQHPDGKIDRMYWPITAHQVMKSNPGHYVSLIIPLSEPDSQPPSIPAHKKTVRYTRVKLLRPTDTLVLGRAYRLVTSQEVKKVLRAKKLAKTKMSEMGSINDKVTTNQAKEKDEEKVEIDKDDKVTKEERKKLKSGSINSRSKTWRPSLQSISEGGS